jgi:hypothetical protein
LTERAAVDWFAGNDAAQVFDPEKVLVVVIAGMQLPYERPV